MARDGSYKQPGQSIVTVPMDPALHKALRVHAATEGRTIKWVVTKAVTDYLATLSPDQPL